MICSMNLSIRSQSSTIPWRIGHWERGEKTASTSNTRPHENNPTSAGLPFRVYLCRIWWFVDGLVSDVKVQIVDSFHHPALRLVSNLGGLFDSNTWRSTTWTKLNTHLIQMRQRSRVCPHQKNPHNLSVPLIWYNQQERVYVIGLKLN